MEFSYSPQHFYAKQAYCDRNYLVAPSKTSKTTLYFLVQHKQECVSTHPQNCGKDLLSTCNPPHIPPPSSTVIENTKHAA